LVLSLSVTLPARAATKGGAPVPGALITLGLGGSGEGHWPTAVVVFWPRSSQEWPW
jgi:hypothetical protein